MSYKGGGWGLRKNTIQQDYSRKYALTHGRTHARTNAGRTIPHDISSTGFQPVELKTEVYKQKIRYSKFLR